MQNKQRNPQMNRESTKRRSKASVDTDHSREKSPNWLQLPLDPTIPDPREGTGREGLLIPSRHILSPLISGARATVERRFAAFAA